MTTYKTYVPHGITLINTAGVLKHTWKAWKIVPTSRPVFLPPAPKLIYEEIPGSDKVLDLTQSLTGEVYYNNRTGSFEFQVENKTCWHNVYSDIMDYMHGQTLKAILDDDPSFFYIGRFGVNKWKSDKYRSKIVIDYDVEPYKYEITSSLESWLWDTFSFIDGIIRDYKDIRVDGSYTLTIEGRRKTVVPSFIVKSDDGTGLKVEFNGVTYTLPDGTCKVIGIRIKEGTNTLTFKGNGTVSVDYRGGRL